MTRLLVMLLAIVCKRADGTSCSLIGKKEGDRDQSLNQHQHRHRNLSQSPSCSDVLEILFASCSRNICLASFTPSTLPLARCFCFQDVDVYDLQDKQV